MINFIYGENSRPSNRDILAKNLLLKVGSAYNELEILRQAIKIPTGKAFAKIGSNYNLGGVLIYTKYGVPGPRFSLDFLLDIMPKDVPAIERIGLSLFGEAWLSSSNLCISSLNKLIPMQDNMESTLFLFHQLALPANMKIFKQEIATFLPSHIIILSDKEYASDYLEELGIHEWQYNRRRVALGIEISSYYYPPHGHAFIHVTQAPSSQFIEEWSKEIVKALYECEYLLKL